MARFVQPDGRVHGVVVGGRRADGRYLMVRRSHLVTVPNKVCFPGGGVDAGETDGAAAVREIREELGIDVRPLRRVWEHAFEQAKMTLYGWLVELPDAAEQALRPDPYEIAEVLWLTREEALAHPDGLPTNRLFIDALEGAIREIERPNGGAGGGEGAAGRKC